MRTFACLLALAACAAAAPTAVLVEVKPEPVPILKQINQVNDDGSYTFGFEAGDGSFRVETKSVTGQITGKYGYIDEFGQQQVVDYVSGKSLGFLPSGMAPTPIVQASSPEQRALDFEYSSVDDDEDGMPDYRPAYKTAYQAPPAYVKESYAPKKDSYGYAEPAPQVVQVVEPVVQVEPLVRLAPQVVVQPQPIVPVAPVRFEPVVVEQQARVPVAIANPDAQFFEDLANQSVDANQDGQPDVFVGPALIETPVQVAVPVAVQQQVVAAAPVVPFTAFNSRRLI